ncbi:MAG: ABC transporter substrate-binding protein [Mesorhizobium sp.]|nr:MAG: ABC transporter substrate-binding protein [Mesorhizobium sp.]TJW65854.1 MAG: ABC transporter substrate-binding protein [Mesorhizobium sp.]
MLKAKGLAVAMLVGLMGGSALADDIKIGVVGGQTGALAIFDQPLLLGAQLAAKKINAAGGIEGKTIQILARDTRSETSEAAVMAQELVSEGVNVLVTPADGDPTIAAGQVGQAADVLTISGTATPPILPGMVGDHLYLNAVPDSIQAAVLGKYAAKTAGYKTAAILLSPDSPYTDKLPKYFGQVFEKYGGKVVSTIQYKMGQQDFTVEVSKIKELNPAPDVIMTSAYEPDFPALLQQLRAAGVDTPVLGSDGIDTQTVVDLGKVSEGVIYSASGFPLPGSRLKAFNKEFQTEYGYPTDTVTSAVGYDLIEIIKAAVERANGKLDGPSLIAGMETIENLPVTTGTITYKGTNRVPLRTVFLVKVTSGHKELVVDETPALEDIPAP